MYPMDRIQQKHARQIDLLENLTALFRIIQIQPVSGTKLENLFFAIRCFMSHFLHKIKVLKNGFCRREIFVN